MTTDLLLWILLALTALSCGWFASAWHFKRKIAAVQLQSKAVRQSAAEHANQARRQIAQLQAELAARPPGTRVHAKPAVRREATPDVTERFMLPEDGFAPTALGPHGFKITQVME